MNKRKCLYYIFVSALCAFTFATGYADVAYGVAIFGMASPLTQSKLYDANTGFSTVFSTAFTAAPDNPLMPLAMRTDSTGNQTAYKWLGQFPGMREWFGDRRLKQMSVHDYTIKNRDFESTIVVDRNDIEDDNLGIYTPMFNDQGRGVKAHPGQLLQEIIQKGKSVACYDSKFFFAADHPMSETDNTTFSNLSAGAALTAQNYEAKKAEMATLTREDKTSLGIRVTHLIVPPQLESAAKAIIKAERLGNGGSNVNYNDCELIVAAELANEPTVWYLADLSRAIKPFILQIRKEPEFVAHDNPADYGVFMRKEYTYGVDDRKNVGFGLPHFIHRCEA